MSLESVVIIGLVLLLASVLWYVALGRMLATREARLGSEEPAPQAQAPYPAGAAWALSPAPVPPAPYQGSSPSAPPAGQPAPGYGYFPTPSPYPEPSYTPSTPGLPPFPQTPASPPSSQSYPYVPGNGYNPPTSPLVPLPPPPPVTPGNSGGPVTGSLAPLPAVPSPAASAETALRPTPDDSATPTGPLGSYPPAAPPNFQTPAPGESAAPTGPLGESSTPVPASVPTPPSPSYLPTSLDGETGFDSNEPTVILSSSMLPPAVAAQIGAATQQYAIRRDLRVEYTRHVYRQRACKVRVRIGPEAAPLPTQTAAERKEFASMESGALEFQADEQEPAVKVEIEFDAADFTARSTSIEKKLSRSAETRFDFTLLPLRAEDAAVRVNMSYVHASRVPEQITSKVVIERRVRGESGEAHTIHEEQLTVLPAREERAEVALRSIELLIEVKSFLRLNASELGLVQKGLGVAATCILLFLGLQNAQLSTLPYLLMSLAPLLGIPIGDAAVKLYDRTQTH